MYCKATLIFELCKICAIFVALTLKMLQRIQSIFMLLAVLCAVALHFTGTDVELFDTKYIIEGITLISAIIGITAIFSFNKRSRQVLLNNLNMFINALLIGVLTYWLLNLSGGIDFPEKGIEPIFPLVALFCLFAANIYIRRDERLVKSVDRLR